VRAGSERARAKELKRLEASTKTKGYTGTTEGGMHNVSAPSLNKGGEIAVVGRPGDWWDIAGALALIK